MLRLRQQLADPLSRNGYALVANSGATGAVGLVYWVLVARLYPTAVVGRASAVYAAMNLLAGLTALNFNGALIRFLPRAGRRTAGLITQSYLVSAAASVAFTIFFLLTISHWGPSYAELGSPITALFFIGCVVAWAAFTLQDSVLTGLRSAGWVLIENTLFGIAKIILLVLFAARLQHLGIYLSWMLPTVAALPLVNMLIYGRLVPRHTAATLDCSPPTNRQIGRFLAGDYSGAMFLLAGTGLVPVLVAARTSDARLTAYFYMAWLVGAILDLVGVNMSMSLTVEGSFDRSSLALNCRKALRKIALILLPCAALTALLAHWGLGFFGPGYAAHSAPVLELLAVATLPRAMTEVYLGALRAQSRTSMVAIIQGTRCVLMLGVTVFLTSVMGLIGAGLAAVLSQGAVALLILPGLWRALNDGRSPRTLAAPGGQRTMTTEVQQPTLSGRGIFDLTRSIRWPSPWSAAVGVLGAAGFVLFLASLHRIALGHMTGLGLVSVLPHRAIAGLTILALAFVLGLALPRVHPAGLGAALVGLVICLDGVTAFVEPAARFPTAYQIAGFVQYISSTGHAAPGLAAYFNWPGFFALISLIAGAAGTHGVLALMRVWPMLINLLCLPPYFLMMRNLRISWRARWLAGFLFVVGNWVGQDYFSPQSFNYVLYLVFLAILVNWFTEPGLSAHPHVMVSGLARVHRRIFGIVRPGELSPRPASTSQRAFLLAVLITIVLVSTMSHQLTPFYMAGACLGLVVIRRCRLSGLPVLFAVIVVGWLSFAAVDYWGGHLSTIFGGIGNLGANVTSSVGGRLAGSNATHLLTLHARVGMTGAIIGLAVLGLLRRRFRGFDDRVLITLFVLPIPTVGLQSYGGEIALRIYLFTLPPACVLAACLFFPDPVATKVSWRVIPVLLLSAITFPVSFLLVRYGNEAFEQIPTGEVAAANWIYAHDADGVRLLWLSSSPSTDVTPEMPWSYRDMDKVDYFPVLAPRNPDNVMDLLYSLHSGGSGAYLIVTGTQETYLEQGGGYPADWSAKFQSRMSADPLVRTVFANSSATIYTLRWPPGTRPQPLPGIGGGHASYPVVPDVAELCVLLLLIAVLVVREFIRIGIGGPSASRLIRPLTLASWPLLVLTTLAVIARFAGLPSIHGGLL